MFFFLKSYRSWWIFWIVNSLRLHLINIRINYKFNFWFSKSSQKFRKKNCYLSFRHQISQINLFRYQIANTFHYIYVYLHAKCQDFYQCKRICIDLCLFFRVFRCSTIVNFDHVVFDQIVLSCKDDEFDVHFYSKFWRLCIFQFFIQFVTIFALFTVKIYVAWKIESCQNYFQKLLFDFTELSNSDWVLSKSKSWWSWNFQFEKIIKIFKSRVFQNFLTLKISFNKVALFANFFQITFIVLHQFCINFVSILYQFCITSNFLHNQVYSNDVNQDF